MRYLQGYRAVPTQDEELGMEGGAHAPEFASAFDFSQTYSQTTDFGSAFKYRSPNELSKSGLPSSRYAQNWVLGKRFRSEHLLRENSGHLRQSILETIVIIFCYCALFATLPFSLFFCIRFVAQFERLVVFRLGRLLSPKGPGTVIILPCIDSCKSVDLRTKAFNVPPIQVVSADKGLVELGATVYYHIKDALAAINSVQDWNQATRTLAHTTLQRTLNKKQVSDLEKHKRDIASDLVDDLNTAAFTWGMEITQVDFSDIKILKEPENNAESVIKALSNPEVAGRIFSQFAGQMGGGIKGPVVPKAIEIAGESINTLEAPPPSVPPPAVAKGPAETSDTVLKLVSTIRSVLSPSLVAEVGSTFEVCVEGEGEFSLDLSSGGGRCELGRKPDAEVSIGLGAGDLAQLLLGQLSPFDAYLSGRITIQGNPRAAVKLEAIAKHVKAHYGTPS